MACRSLREFIETLEKMRDIVHIKQEVDWDLEVGATLANEPMRHGRNRKE
jgi:UbiD family decarboxylase